MARIPLIPLVLGLLATAGAGAAAAPEWPALADLGTVVVETVDEDGSARETTVWLAVVDGVGYVRTGSSTWGENAVRSRELVLEAGGARYPLQIELVEDDAVRQGIADAFRAKYGWSDAMVSWMRGAHPRIMRLVPKPQE